MSAPGIPISPPRGNGIGALWMMLNAAVFSLQVTLVKMLATDVPQSMIMLSMVGVQGLVVWISFGRSTLPLLREGPHLPHLWRAGLMIFGLFLGIASVRFLPVAEATAVSFFKPLFVTALAALALGERLTPTRILAVALGFAGVILLLRPGGGEAWALAGVTLGLGSAFAVAVATISTRVLAQRHPAPLLMTYQTAVGTALILPWALTEWTLPEGTGLVVLISIGLLSVVGNLATILALRHAEASVVAPIDFTRAVFAGLFAYLLLSEVPTPAALAGTGLIVLGALIAIRGGRR